MASTKINDFGNKYPEYYFPHIELDKYLNWEQYKKAFKGSNELTLINHWLKFTGVLPKKEVDKELQKIYDNLL